MAKSEGWIVNLDVVVCDALLAELLKKSEFVVRPNSVAQIIQKFDDGHGLVG